MAKLVVRKDLLDSEVHCEVNGMSQAIVLKIATQEQLAILKELGVDVFEEKPKS
jgi:phosphopantothenoylcysteine synthetase/decarboxylase